MLASFEAFILFAAYLVASLLLLCLFTSLYLRVTPYDDIKDIHDGKVAPAIALGGAMLGFTFPLLMASYLHASYWSFIVWSLIAGIIQLGVFMIMYRMLPRVIETNNVAGAVIFAVAAACVGLMNAASFIP